jgi:hypothetical protein
LLITAGCSCLFVALSIGVLIGGPLVRLDQLLADTLHTHASEAPALTDFLHIIILLGSLKALVFVRVIVAIALIVRRCWSALAAWLVAVLGSEALNLLLKEIFARPRPPSNTRWWSRPRIPFPADRRWSRWSFTGCLPTSPCSP